MRSPVRSMLLGLSILAGAVHPSILNAQPAGARLVGHVRDPSNQPLAGVAVLLDGGRDSTLTDPSGLFELQDLTDPDHVVLFQKLGFQLLNVEFSIPPRDAHGTASLGDVRLEPAPLARYTVNGNVIDAVAGTGVADVAVSRDSTVLGYTDHRGAFTLAGLGGRGGARLTFQRIGYQKLVWDFWAMPPDTVLAFRIHLAPVAVRLGEVVVEGDRASVRLPFMEGFEQRRKLGFGTFMDEQRIEQLQATFDALSLLRWAGAQVTGDVAMGNEGVALFGPVCHPPVFFIDGVQWNNEIALLRLETLAPGDVGGIEIYRHAGEIPPQFNVTGAACGVVVVWTKR